MRSYTTIRSVSDTTPPRPSSRLPQVEDYIAFIQTFPGVDGPEVFGLHPNADLTFRNKEGQQLLATLMETQPKQAAGGTGRSREDMVSRDTLEITRS